MQDQGYPIVQKIYQEHHRRQQPAESQAINYSINEPDTESALDEEDHHDIRHITEQIGHRLPQAVPQAVVQHQQAPRAAYGHIMNANPSAITAAQYQMQKLVFHQKEIRKCGKCVTYFGYLLYVSAIVGIVSNVLFILMSSSYTKFPMHGFNNNIHWLQLDTDTLVLMALGKIALSIAFLFQAKGALGIFKPILKEYRDAESGTTRGIVMAERKTRKMKAHKSYVKKLTCCMLVAVVLCFPFMKSLAQDTIDQVIDMYYEDIANQSTKEEESVWVEIEEEVPEVEEETQGKSIQEDATNELPRPGHPWFNRPIPGAQARLLQSLAEQPESSGRDTWRMEAKQVNEMTQGEAKEDSQWIIREKVNRLLDHIAQMCENVSVGYFDQTEEKRAIVAEMKTMTPAQLKEAMSYYIVCMIVFCQFMSIVSIACFQGAYLYMLDRAMKSQQKLEDWFMGPEVTEAAAAAIPMVRSAPQPIAIIQSPQVHNQDREHAFVAIPATGNLPATSNSMF